VSEYDFVDESFVPEATDVAAWADTSPPISRTPVADRFFDRATGEPLPVLALENDRAWTSWLSGFEDQVAQAQAGRGPDASVFHDEGPPSLEAAYADEALFTEAAQAQATLENARALRERVSQMGQAREFGVRDPAAVARVAAQVDETVAAWAQAQVAAGVSGRQLAQAVGGWEFQSWLDNEVRSHLEEARYDRLVARTEMRKHGERVYEQQRLDAELGLGPEPQPAWLRHPSLQKMAARMDAYARRVGEQQQALAAIRARHRRSW
jgi:hypothetical protein